jgi:hypothetical protein
MRQTIWLTIGACLVLLGCNPVAAAPSPSASFTPAPMDTLPPRPSPEPSPSESATPTGPVVDSVPIPADTYAVVVTDDLRVRLHPGVTNGSTTLEPLLQDGVRVVVLDGPVQASGYDWYLVQPTITSDTADPYPFGWVAAADRDGEPWIEPESVECPPLPTTVEELGEMNQVAALFFEVSCFGGKDITFEARLRQPREDICDDEPWGVDPGWLDVCVGDAPIFVPVKASPEGLQLVAR